MPGQSGASEIKAGKNWINRGSGCDHSPQAMKATVKDAKRVAMRTVSPLTVAMLLGFGATALVAAEQPATGPSGFSAATESANSKGKTGDSRPSPSLRAATNHPSEPLASASCTRYNETRPR
jgi:hypothetical protein